MSRWTALLVFVFLPSAAARRLLGSRIAIVLPFVFGAGVAAFFLVAGADEADAWWAGVTYVRYVCGLAIGATVFGFLALRIVKRDGSWKELLGPASAAAAWSPVVFVAALGVMHLLGAGAPAGLYAGLLVLLWAAAAGMAAIGGDESVEPGRLLVATCLALSGCLLGFWLAHRAPPAVAVIAVRAPFRAGDVEPGDVILVRTVSNPRAPCVVLLREAGTPEAVFARLDHNGTRTPLGNVAVPAAMLREWNIAGRAFFRFGAARRWSVLGTEQIPQPSQD